jgi:hypothetical protein
MADQLEKEIKQVLGLLGCAFCIKCTRIMDIAPMVDQIEMPIVGFTCPYCGNVGSMGVDKLKEEKT